MEILQLKSHTYVRILCIARKLYQNIVFELEARKNSILHFRLLLRNINI